MEITNALRKTIKSLSQAKNRRAEGLFVAEGHKCVHDTAGNFSCRFLIASRQWLDTNPATIALLNPAQICPASSADLQRMSQLSTPPQVIAAYQIPPNPILTPQLITSLSQHLVVALDRIQDPGNLGTIIRLCDWFGISTLLLQHESADVWSPKVIQATMGAISRVTAIYCNLPQVLAAWPKPVFGTFLAAPSIYQAPLQPSGVVVFGNEGNGISPQVAQTVTNPLFIPSFPPDRQTSESLNVATAAAITISQFRSRQLHSRN